MPMLFTYGPGRLKSPLSMSGNCRYVPTTSRVLATLNVAAPYGQPYGGC